MRLPTAPLSRPPMADILDRLAYHQPSCNAVLIGSGQDGGDGKGSLSTVHLLPRLLNPSTCSSQFQLTRPYARNFLVVCFWTAKSCRRRIPSMGLVGMYDAVSPPYISPIYFPIHWWRLVQHSCQFLRLAFFWLNLEVGIGQSIFDGD